MALRIRRGFKGDLIETLEGVSESSKLLQRSFANPTGVDRPKEATFMRERVY